MNLVEESLRRLEDLATAIHIVVSSSSRPRTTRRAPHTYPDISGDGFQYHLSQLTFSDQWVLSPVMHPEDVGSTPGSVTFPPPGVDTHRGLTRWVSK